MNQDDDFFKCVRKYREDYECGLYEAKRAIRKEALKKKV